MSTPRKVIQATKKLPRPVDLKPWEQQPWENERAYQAFFEFYLMQEEKPRTQTRAYERYAAANGLSTRRKRGRVDVPNYFHCWVYGVDSNNDRPAGTVWENARSWEERAREYDKSLFEEAEARFRARQIALREKEWESGSALLERAEAMMNQFDPSVTEWTDDTIAKHMETALKLMRRAAGMPEKVEAAANWRKEIKLIGMNPDDVLESFAELLATFTSGESEESDPGSAL